MGIFVEVREGTTAAVPRSAETNCAMIIGRSTTLPDTNPFLATSSVDLSVLTTTDSAYIAGNYYFNEVGGNADLWVYCLSGTEESISGVLLQGARDGSNSEFYIPYSPIVSIGSVQIKIASLDDGSGWVTVPQEDVWYSTGTTNGKVNGIITLGTSGAYYSYAALSGDQIDGVPMYLGADDYIRANITVGTLGKAFDALNDEDIYFQTWTLAYDQNYTATLDPTGITHKYQTGACYGGTGWLDDTLVAGNMATQFNNIGKYAVYCGSIPDNVKPNSLLTGWATGTTYTGSRFSDIRDIVGSNKNVALFSAKQGADGDDPGAAAMGTLMRDPPRMPFATAIPETFTQTEFAKDPEILGWRGTQVNCFSKKGGNNMWMDNFTLGTGFNGTINYVRCVGLLKKKLADVLLQAIMTRKLKYNLAGINYVESVIESAIKQYQSLNIIDPGDITVTIPIKSYLVRAGALSVGELAILNAAKLSKVLADIEVTFPWDGDIQSIVISSLING